MSDSPQPTPYQPPPGDLSTPPRDDGVCVPIPLPAPKPADIAPAPTPPPSKPK